MKTIKEKIDILEATIKSLKIIGKKAIDEDDNDKLIYCMDNIALQEEIVEDLKVLGKFIGYYLVGSDDENNITHIEIDCNSADGKAIDEYVDKCMDDYYRESQYGK